MSGSHGDRRPALFAILVGAVLVPSRVEAHLVTTGLGPVYDGISHLFVSPDDLLPVITMGLLAGLNGVTAARRTLFALTGAWLIGGMAGLLTGSAAIPAGIAGVSLLVIGGLTAADRPLPQAFVTSIALAFGVVHGWLNGSAIAAAGRDGLGLVGRPPQSPGEAEFRRYMAAFIGAALVVGLWCLAATLFIKDAEA